MIDARQQILLMATGLYSAGESTRVICPWCSGGETREKTFSITRAPNGVLYHCYRGTCSIEYPSSGFIPSNGPMTYSTKPVEYKSRDWFIANYMIEPIQALLSEDYEELRREYRITEGSADEAGLRVTTDQRRWAIPVFSVDGAHRGWHLRTRRSVEVRDGYGKAMSFQEEPGPWAGWYVPYVLETSPDSLVIVEDHFSAMRVAQDYQSYSVALMGSTLTPEVAREIAGMKFSRVLLALDRDAAAKAIKAQKEFGLLIPNMRVVALSRDLKDTDASTMQETLDKALKSVV